MSAQAIVIDSDEEPQPKKQKHDRSPLVVINGENGPKKKQLTLKDMVSPKPKQTTLSNFKAFSQSPKAAPSAEKKQSPQTKTNQLPNNKSPKEDAVSSTVTSDISTTPVRGVKRKSDFSEEEIKEGTPVKQAKIPPMEKINVEDSPKYRGNSKPVVPKPTLESMLIRSPKQENSKKTNPETHNDVAKTSNRTNSKSTSDVENTISVKPVKKKFGDYKRKQTKSAEESKVIQTSVSCDKPNSGAVKTDEKVIIVSESTANVDANTSNVQEAVTLPNDSMKSAEKDIEVSPSAEKNMEVSPSDIIEKTETEAKENVEPDESKTSTSHVDNEIPGPSGVNKTAAKKRPLTAKQKKLQEEREKKKQEAEKEKERKRLEREKEKELREEAKRAEQAKKDAEKAAREKAREEARQKKEEEKKQKEEEKRLKEEEKDAERKKKLLESEEEKRLKEEELERKRQKKLKEQEKFKSFFVVKKPSVASVAPKVETLEKKFRDFVITPNMMLAPITRTEPVSGDILPAGPLKWTSNLDHIRDVIQEMRSKQKYETDQLSSELEIISISKPNEIKVKRKTLHFHENHRPAYYGSWRKKSSIIRPRHPLGQDKTLLDYDYDSDEDWEEEEEGEDISSEKEDEKEEEKEKEKEGEDDDEDDGFFVPHGYLSDDEGDEDCGMTDEAKKRRLEQRKKQFEEEQKSKESGVLKAKIVGPAWNTDPTPSDPARFLSQFSAVWSTDLSDSEPFDPFARVQPVAQMETDSSVKNDKKALPVAGYAMLIRFLHGSPIGMSRAVETFQEMWHSDPTRGKVSKRQLTQLIPTLVTKCMRPGNGMKLCWYASDEVLTKHELNDLVGLHSEPPEPPKPQPPPAVSLLKFTKTSSAERDLAELRQKQSLLEALQQAVKLQKDAILLQQQQQQQQQAKTEPPQNTLRNFLSNSSSSGPVKRIPLTPVPNTNSVVTNSVVTNNSTTTNSAGQTLTKAPVPRRIALVPIKNVSATPINIEDSN